MNKLHLILSKALCLALLLLPFCLEAQVLSVKILDSDDQHPLDFAYLQYSDSKMRYSTDESGIAKIGKSPVGIVKLRIYRAWYLSDSLIVKLPVKRDSLIVISLKKDKDLFNNVDTTSSSLLLVLTYDYYPVCGAIVTLRQGSKVIAKYGTDELGLCQLGNMTGDSVFAIADYVGYCKDSILIQENFGAPKLNKVRLKEYVVGDYDSLDVYCEFPTISYHMLHKIDDSFYLNRVLIKVKGLNGQNAVNKYVRIDGLKKGKMTDNNGIVAFEDVPNGKYDMIIDEPFGRGICIHFFAENGRTELRGYYDGNFNIDLDNTVVKSGDYMVALRRRQKNFK